MIIQHNMAAANANRMLGSVVTTQSKSTEKLSSGYRINRAADDAAGLSISEKMRGQIRGLDQASTNAQDGISMIQTAEGALNETHSILQRMRELAVQASTGTETDDDRTAIQAEITELQSEIDRIANDTEFNTMKLLDGSKAGTAPQAAKEATKETWVFEDADFVRSNDSSKTITKVKLGTSEFKVELDAAENASIDTDTLVSKLSSDSNVGGKYTVTKTADGKVQFVAKTEGVVAADDKITEVGGSAVDVADRTVTGAAATDEVKESGGIQLQVGANKDQTINFRIEDMSSTGLDVDTTKVKCDTQTDAQSAITTIDDAIKKVSTQRSNLGAKQNRLEHTIANLDTSSENLQTAESRIRDVDMAKEMVTYSKNNILQQAAQSMLAQANQSTQGVLSLLQ